ncbi:MAG: hypothetical protein JOZ14_04025 [Acidobacteria bacterium]|nr:hypothetical protein [Acidobacteriota bacterium]
MSVPVVVDTNVFIYALDEGDKKKRDAARAWRAELWKSVAVELGFRFCRSSTSKLLTNGPIFEKKPGRKYATYLLGILWLRITFSLKTAGKFKTDTNSLSGMR